MNIRRTNITKSTGMLLILLAICLVPILQSCKPEEKKTLVLIEVISESGYPLPGVTVIIRQDSLVSSSGVTAKIYDEKLTELNGRSSHLLPGITAVLFVDAKLDSLAAHDFIKLDKGETVKKTLVLK